MKKVFLKSELEDMLSFVSENARRHKLKKSEENRAILMAEETLVTMLEHTTGEEVAIAVSYVGGMLKIRLSAKGESFDPLSDEESDPMRTALMRSFAEDIRIRNSKGVNVVTITAFKSRYLLLYKLAGAALLSMAVSLLLKAVASPQVCQWAADQVMTTGKTMFMN